MDLYLKDLLKVDEKVRINDYDIYGERFYITMISNYFRLTTWNLDGSGTSFNFYTLQDALENAIYFTITRNGKRITDDTAEMIKNNEIIVKED